MVELTSQLTARCEKTNKGELCGIFMLGGNSGQSLSSRLKIQNGERSNWKMLKFRWKLKLAPSFRLASPNFAIATFNNLENTFVFVFNFCSTFSSVDVYFFMPRCVFPSKRCGEIQKKKVVRGPSRWYANFFLFLFPFLFALVSHTTEGKNRRERPRGGPERLGGSTGAWGRGSRTPFHVTRHVTPPSSSRCKILVFAQTSASSPFFPPSLSPISCKITVPTTFFLLQILLSSRNLPQRPLLHFPVLYDSTGA